MIVFVFLIFSFNYVTLTTLWQSLNISMDVNSGNVSSFEQIRNMNLKKKHYITDLLTACFVFLPTILFSAFFKERTSKIS